MTEHEPRAGCASAAEVVEGMAVARYHGAFGGVPWELLPPVVRAGCLNAAQKDLTAALALGCLLPDDAAALRGKVEALTLDWEQRNADCVTMRMERDTLAARLKVAEEALRQARETIVLSLAFNGRDSGTERWSKTEKQLVEMWVKTDNDIRAALTPAKGGSTR